MVKIMQLTGKQRAHLRALAHPLPAILYIGKGGVTDTVVRQAEDALTARELIKGKVQEMAPLTAREAAETVAESVQADVVQVMGRTFVLYRAGKDPQIVLPRP